MSDDEPTDYPFPGICVGGSNDGALLRGFGPLMCIPKNAHLGDLDLANLPTMIMNAGEAEIYRYHFERYGDFKSARVGFWLGGDFKPVDALQHLLERHAKLADLEH